MQIITRKPEIEKHVNDALSLLEKNGFPAFASHIEKNILLKKVKFPLLEFAAKKIAENCDPSIQKKLAETIVRMDHIGSYVIAGILLQLQLKTKTAEAFLLAEKYIIKGDKWYVCDIIGERVFGYALLHQSSKTFPALEKNAKHRNNWMVRSVGVAAHYAIKKELDEKNTEKMFRLLLSLSASTDFHTKKGIGWAVKTTAKFHPGIIKKYEKQIHSDLSVRTWFKTKIRIGLNRHRYAR